jgi:hypothetical protein
MHGKQHQRKLGAALSLDKWASAKVSKYDKRKVIEKQKQLKAKQANKLKRLKKRLEAEGRLAAPTPQVRALGPSRCAAAAVVRVTSSSKLLIDWWCADSC